jgi:nucleotide-binding universal stress UspA family protein
MFQTIVIGFDGSGQSHDALALALKLADAGTELIAVCVHPFQPVTVAVVPGARGIGARAGAEAVLAEARRAARPRALRCVAQPAASPAAGLLAVADEVTADLVVLGPSHRGRIARHLPGDTILRVTRDTACPVAIAPLSFRSRAEAPGAALGAAG